MTYILTKTWTNPDMQRLAEWSRMMMEACEPTAKAIGVSVEAIVGQAALESNWGRSVVGQHNLFGIKADPSWTGVKVLAPTWEFLNGQNVTMHDWFRDYASFQASVEDHFNFLKTNSNYTKAGVFSAHNDAEYFAALKAAGYATAPDYVQKLIEVSDSVRIFTKYMTRTDEPALASNMPRFTRLLLPGRTGSDVVALQAHLGIRQSGTYDTETRAAVLEAQRKLGFQGDDVDGLAGKITLTAMGLVWA